MTKPLTTMYVSLQGFSSDGEKPVDLLAHFMRQSTKQRQMMFDQVTSSSRILCKSFLENRSQNRVPVPLHEKKRVVLTVAKEGDGDYIPATYACCERDDYIIIQAPTKENYRDYWRMVWRDGCKICVSLSEKLSASDSSLCYPYWPLKEGGKIEIENNRFVIECQKRIDCKGYVIYELGLISTDPSLESAVSRVSQQSTDEESDEKKSRSVTLMHFEKWPSDTWPDLDLLGPFVQALTKKEIQSIEKISMKYFHSRAPIVWVSMILMKDIERKECFDVEDLAKKCARARPGAFHKKVHYCALFALAFRLSALGGWTALENARTRIKEIQIAYEASLKK
ncbi:Protein-tyrosine phosphatase [Dictyocaulus viviparus]|uniref:Protein-tyrosine phosphatase n=1 Tax=Dictyocaulus viviparus TaxID=29172 RepID=A0A0D8XMV9_DICVI|nr:Protein-tyrosine phosphatase [Dictyocaulus viviparus]